MFTGYRNRYRLILSGIWIERCCRHVQKTLLILKNNCCLRLIYVYIHVYKI